jgi:hypothetical protein
VGEKSDKLEILFSFRFYWDLVSVNDKLCLAISVFSIVHYKSFDC